jgi:RNA polymerase sigma factor (sigma-70 family)
LSDHDGTEISFDEFFRRDFPRLVGFLLRLGHSKEDAEDAAAEAMALAYVKWGMVSQPRGWVRSTASRAAWKIVLRRRRGIELAVEGGWPVGPEHSPDLAADAILKDEQRDTMTALRSLPPRQRAVMAWFIDGFTIDEIGVRLEMNLATVRSNLRHARHALKDDLRGRP